MPKLTPNQCTLAELQDLVCRARAELLSGPIACVAYPEGSGPRNWNVDQISKTNRNLLRNLAHCGNVYALFVGECEQWTAMYVGQRKCEKLGERMRQHLVRAQTGSQIERVQKAVAEGKRVGISYVLIEPDALRHYVEESIIAMRAVGELPWNSHQ